MDIIIKKEAPLELVRIIDQVCSDIHTINKVIIDAFIPELAPKKALGAFDPETGTIYIDMANCLMDKRWMEKGCLFIPNVWINLMYAVHHEVVHACQVIDNPNLIAMNPLPKEVEDEALEMAQDAVFSWFEQGGKIPPLREMGWVGEGIAATLNGLFSRMPEDVIKEMDMLKVGAVAEVDAVIVSHDHFNDIDLLHSEIDNGKIGLKVNGQRYLTADEFLAI